MTATLDTLTPERVHILKQLAQKGTYPEQDGKAIHRIATEIEERLNPPLFRLNPLGETEFWQIHNRAQYSGFAHASDEILQLCKTLKILIDEGREPLLLASNTRETRT